jgi:hypothetical protein
LWENSLWEKVLWEKSLWEKSLWEKGFPASPNVTVAFPHKILTLPFQNFPSLRLSSAQINKRHSTKLIIKNHPLKKLFKEVVKNPAPCK